MNFDFEIDYLWFTWIIWSFIYLSNHVTYSAIFILNQI